MVIDAQYTNSDTQDTSSDSLLSPCQKQDVVAILANKLWTVVVDEVHKDSTQFMISLRSSKNGVTRISFFWAYDNANVDWIVAHFRIAISISQKIRQFFHIEFLDIELKLKRKLTKVKEHQKHERNKDGSDWRRFKADYERVDELWPVIVDVHDEFPMFSVQSEHGGSTANISSAAFFMLLGSSMWD